MSFWRTALFAGLFFALLKRLAPKPDIEDAKRGGLGDFKFPTATEGRSVPLVWGTVRIDGPNVIWYGNLVQDAITEKIKTGMFSSHRIITGWEYSIGIQFALCRGPLTGSNDGFLGMWVGDDKVFTGVVTADNNIVISEPELFGGEDLGNGGFVGTWKFHAGASNQAVSTYLTGFQLEGGDTPAYLGTCYLAPANAPAYIGNSTRIKPFKFEIRRIPNGLALTSGHELVNSVDCNPMAVLYEIMTNTDWGLGYDVAKIDVANLRTAGDTLFDEGNGFSFVLDRPMEASELIRMLENQIDGVLFFNQSTAQWQMKLIRADYNPATVPNINIGNLSEDGWTYSRGSWDSTSNIVNVEYSARSDEYKTTFGLAQDTANVRIQGRNVSVTIKYPGVKDDTLANTLAWRDLRTLSYPLAKATVVVDRTFWDVNPGDPITFTHAVLGVTALPMRIQKIDFGELANNKIRLDLVQDVFFSQAPSFADPGSTGWSSPQDNLLAFPTAQQRAFEAPRALVRRDPDTGGNLVAKIYAMARKQGAEAKFEIRERNAAGAPAGAYQEAGTVYQFLKIGQLTGALTVKSAYPLAVLNITDNPDSDTDIVEAINTAASVAELGVEFTNLILIGDEFMLVSSAAFGAGTTVDLADIYRGALDSVQADHAANADVFIVTAGAGITLDTVEDGNNVDVILIPMSLSDELLEASATVINFQMDKRNLRPYPPSLLSLNTVDWDTTAVDLQSAGSGFEDFSATLAYRRRDFRVADGNNEILALLTDAVTFAAGDSFPGDNSTDHDIEVRHDPSGTNELILNTTIAGTTFQLQLIDIWIGLNGAAPTGDIRVICTASHTDLASGSTLTARQDLVHDFTVANDKSGEFEFGLLSIGEGSALYTVTDVGVHAFTLSSATAVGDIEFQINGGGWNQLIAQGGTTGNTASLSVSDTIEVRHQSSDSNLKKVLTMNAAAAAQDGFAVLEN